MLKHYVRRTHPKALTTPSQAILRQQTGLKEEAAFELPRLDWPLFIFFSFLTVQLFASAAALWATL